MEGLTEVQSQRVAGDLHSEPCLCSVFPVVFLPPPGCGAECLLSLSQGCCLPPSHGDGAVSQGHSRRQAGLQLLRLSLGHPLCPRNMTHIGQVARPPWGCFLVCKIGGINPSQSQDEAHRCVVHVSTLTPLPGCLFLFLCCLSLLLALECMWLWFR